jgi:hypothetical protein
MPLSVIVQICGLQDPQGSDAVTLALSWLRRSGAASASSFFGERRLTPFENTPYNVMWDPVSQS